MRFSRQGYCSGLPFPSPGDLPNPGIEAGLLHCRQILYQWATREAPKWKWKSLSCVRLCDLMDYTAHEILQARILEWVAVPFSRGLSQPRDQTQVSHIAGRYFTRWATREAKQTYIDKWNRIESTEINPHIHNQLKCDKGVEKTPSGRNSLFNKWCWDKWTVTGKRLKVDSCLATLKNLLQMD